MANLIFNNLIFGDNTVASYNLTYNLIKVHGKVASNVEKSFTLKSFTVREPDLKWGLLSPPILPSTLILHKVQGNTFYALALQ